MFVGLVLHMSRVSYFIALPFRKSIGRKYYINCMTGIIKNRTTLTDFYKHI